MKEKFIFSVYIHTMIIIWAVSRQTYGSIHILFLIRMDLFTRELDYWPEGFVEEKET